MQQQLHLLAAGDLANGV